MQATGSAPACAELQCAQRRAYSRAAACAELAPTCIQAEPTQTPGIPQLRHAQSASSSLGSAPRNRLAARGRSLAAALEDGQTACERGTGRGDASARTRSATRGIGQAGSTAASCKPDREREAQGHSPAAAGWQCSTLQTAVGGPGRRGCGRSGAEAPCLRPRVGRLQNEWVASRKGSTRMLS